MCRKENMSLLKMVSAQKGKILQRVVYSNVLEWILLKMVSTQKGKILQRVVKYNILEWILLQNEGKTKKKSFFYLKTYTFFLSIERFHIPQQ